MAKTASMQLSKEHPEADMGLQKLRSSKNTSIHVPDVMKKLVPTVVTIGVVEPTPVKNIDKEWYNQSIHDNSSAIDGVGRI